MRGGRRRKCAESRCWASLDSSRSTWNARSTIASILASHSCVVLRCFGAFIRLHNGLRPMVDVRQANDAAGHGSVTVNLNRREIAELIVKLGGSSIGLEIGGSQPHTYAVAPWLQVQHDVLCDD